MSAPEIREQRDHCEALIRELKIAGHRSIHAWDLLDALACAGLQLSTAQDDRVSAAYFASLAGLR